MNGREYIVENIADDLEYPPRLPGDPCWSNALLDGLVDSAVDLPAERITLGRMHDAKSISALTTRATRKFMLHLWVLRDILSLRLSLRLCCAVPLVRYLR